MKKLVSFSAAILAGAALGSGLTAQRDRAAGIGKIELGPIDLDAQTMNDGQLGVQELNGEYFVTSRGVGALPPHLVYVFNGAGNLTRQFTQQGGTATSAWGYRDGATDGVSLIFGYESGIEVINPADGSLVTTVIARSGPQTIVNPIQSQGTVVTHRAVAYDPGGAGGKGSLFIGDFGSAIEEIDLSGKVLNTYANQASPNDWSSYGLALDPITGNLWVNSAPNAGGLAEIDRPTGRLTGNVIPRVNGGSAQGGLCAVSLGAADFRSGVDLVGLDQATPDSFSRYRLHLHNGVIGTEEASLVAGKDGGALSDNGVVAFSTKDTSLEFGFDITADPGKAGRAALYGINFGPDAVPNARNFFFHEMTLVSPISTPAGVLLVFADSGGLGTPPLSFSPPNIGVGNQLRLQGAYAERFSPVSGVMMTNQVRFEQRVPPVGVTVLAEGTNSFNAVTTSGFFSVTNNSGQGIAKVEFDWVTSSNPAQATMVFDTDQTGMADVFEGGDSVVAGCLGTYRNGSDATTGLVYDATNTVPASPCDPAANTGWIGTNATVVDAWKTLEFRFAGFDPGEKFEFDVDTDGGAGINGGAMAGMVVTVTMADLTVVKGELIPDAIDPLKSQVEL